MTYVRPPVFFDVLCSHNPLGTRPGDNLEGTLRVQCWVRKISARNPYEAGRKAETFLTEHRGVSNITVKRWKFSQIADSLKVQPRVPQGKVEL